MALRIKPLHLEVDAKAIEAMLEAARRALPEEHFACLLKLLDSYREIIRLAQERGTSLARLKRLFHLQTSEKTGDVFPDAPSQPTDDSEQSAPGANVDESADHAGDAGESPENPDVVKPKRKRKGHGRIPATKYHVEPIAVKLTSHCVGDICSCGGIIGGYNSAPIVRIDGQPPLGANRWELEQGRCGTCGRIYTAKPPPAAQGPKYTDEAAATLALLRYRIGVPHHRLEQVQANLGVPVPAGTQYGVLKERAEEVKPILAALVDEAANAELLYTDDTNMRILEYMGKRRAKLEAAGELDRPDRTGIFTTGVVAKSGEHTIILYFTGRQHAGENLNTLLDKRDPERTPPTHMCDGLDRNRPIDHEVVEANCLAHGRRGVVEEATNFPSDCKHVLEQLRIVFHNEATCKALGLSASERLAYHQTHSQPIMEELRQWIATMDQERRIEPNSGLGKSLAYLTKRWDQLTLFLRVPGAPLENNACERVLKLAIRHRNASLFYRTAKGAQIGDLYMSLLNTAEQNGISGFEYLVALLKNSAAVAADPKSWLPWNFRETLATQQIADSQVA